MATLRFESLVAAVSWNRSEAVSGPSEIPFAFGVTHDDEPPPDLVEDRSVPHDGLDSDALGGLEATHAARSRVS